MFFPIQSQKKIFALGSEFDTRLAFFCDGKIIFSDNTRDLANDIERYEKFVVNFLHNLKLTPDVIITDLHPLYSSRKIGAKLAAKFAIPHISVQHHIAHIFVAAESYWQEFSKQNIFCGIACDGTGYGLDENIWGGEVFFIHRNDVEKIEFERIGHLQYQHLIGADLAIEEPARMLISILSKFLKKREVFEYVKKYYTENEFELLYNQRKQEFNSPLSSSTARILDAVSVLLGFCANERKYKHYAAEMLEKNTDIVKIAENLNPRIEKNDLGEYVLDTTYLFEYLIRNINSDKKKAGSRSAKIYY